MALKDVEISLGRIEERIKNHIWFAGITALVIFGWLGWLSVSVYQMNGTLSGIDRMTRAAQQLAQASSRPEKPENQAAAKQLLADAAQKSISIPPAILEQAGKSFIDAARKDPKAWDALDFVSYRSSNFIFHRSFTGIELPADKVLLHYDVGPFVPGKPHPKLRGETFAAVSSAEAARYESIGQNLNKEVGVPVVM